MKRSLTGILVALTTGCGPTATAPVANPPPAKVAAPAAPAVRWVFARPPIERARIDVGEGGVLLVGQGRRRLMLKGKPALEADTLVPPDTLAIARTAAGYVFVTAEGELHDAATPLGVVTNVRKTPSAIHRAAGSGQALVILTKQGLLRSTDGGTTWNSPAIDASLAKVVDVTMRSDGVGLALAMPQRALLTTDHGATWTTIPTPGIGAQSVSLEPPANGAEALGAITLEGSDWKRIARLEGTPPRLYADDKPVAPPTKPIDASQTIVGERVVHLSSVPIAGSQHARSWKLAIGKLEELPDWSKVAPNSLLEGCPRVKAAGSQSELLLLCTTLFVKDASTRILRSVDGGKTFSRANEWPGAVHISGVEMVSGPGTALYLGPTCMGSAPECPRRVRLPDGSFRELALQAPAELDDEAIAFDASGARVYLLGKRYGEDVADLWVADTKSGPLRKTKTTLPFPSGATGEMHLDSAGVLRVSVQRGGELWPRVAVASDGSERKLPPLSDRLDAVAFSGDRGLAFGSSMGFETADGGESWTRIATNGEGWSVACNTLGCMVDGNARLGWSLPAGSRGPIADPAARSSEKLPTKAKAPPPSSASLRCERTGKPTTIPYGYRNFQFELGSEVHLLDGMVGSSEKTTILVQKGKTAPRELTLFGAREPPKKGDLRVHAPTKIIVGDRGVVAARFSYAPASAPKAGEAKPTSKYSPVDAELAWYEVATDKIQKVSVKAIGRFRVPRSRNSLGGNVQIVEGGLLFHGDADDMSWKKIGSNGKVEDLLPTPVPPGDITIEGESPVLTRGLASAPSSRSSKANPGRPTTGASSLTSRSSIQSMPASPPPTTATARSSW